MQIKYDVLGIGNAIMDVIAPIDDVLLDAQEIAKGSMTLVDEARALGLHKAFKSGSKQIVEIAGGSGANTVAGIAALGVSAAYIGKVADDATGRRFTKSMSGLGIASTLAPLKNGPATARSLIAVTPDGERSMSTFLGANVTFGPKDIDPNLVKSSAVTYLEGYLFDTDEQKAAFVKAAEIATAAGRKVALTLSDAFCVGRHRGAFQHLVDNHVDILSCLQIMTNCCLCTKWTTLAIVYAGCGKQGQLLALLALRRVLSLSKTGFGVENIASHVHTIACVPVSKVVDTTGAGDQYAAGVLAGRAMDMSWKDAGHLGSLAAAEIITHYGARPETSIHGLAMGGMEGL